jgi:hypothetical protein
MAAGPDYDSSLARLAGEGVTDAQDLVYALALEDLAEAAAPDWAALLTAIKEKAAKPTT